MTKAQHSKALCEIIKQARKSNFELVQIKCQFPGVLTNLLPDHQYNSYRYHRGQRAAFMYSARVLRRLA